jgi:hypothetical protein
MATPFLSLPPVPKVKLLLKITKSQNDAIGKVHNELGASLTSSACMEGLENYIHNPLRSQHISTAYSSGPGWRQKGLLGDLDCSSSFQ